MAIDGSDPRSFSAAWALSAFAALLLVIEGRQRCEDVREDREIILAFGSEAMNPDEVRDRSRREKKYAALAAANKMQICLAPCP